jgi:NAD(P)-dependent dehydrogenase (short-subunit alcohol dehydrogenase family)
LQYSIQRRRWSGGVIRAGARLPVRWRPLVAATAPVPRSATPDDCAEATLALVRNRYVSGEIFVVDGGLTQLM